MRKILLLSTFIILFTNCNIKEKPEFIKVEKIEITNASAKIITLNINAIFNNPNDIGGSLNCENIVILINDVALGKISSEDFKVPAHKEFKVPLEVTINTKEILGSNSISGILNSFVKKTIKVQYKGDIIYRLVGSSFKYHIDTTENVKLIL